MSAPTGPDYRGNNPQTFGRMRAITDICLLVENIDRSVEFYTEKLGFVLWRRHPHFADFHGLGVTLALWRRDHFRQIANVNRLLPDLRGGGALVAVQLGSFAEVDECYASLCRSGVVFTSAPVDLPWDARGAYFTDPDGTYWELYAYREGVPTD